MSQKLPVSRVVQVDVILTPAGAQSQSLSDLLILGTSAVIDPSERYRLFSSSAEVAAAFGTAAEEYKAASLWFQQRPQPTRLMIGRWAKTAAAGGLRGAPRASSDQNLDNWRAVTQGAFRYTVNGGAATQTANMNFSSVNSMNAVAAVIQSGMAGVTVTWNATLSRFEFTSNTTGPASVVGFLTAPSSGTDISLMAGGRAESSGAYSFNGVAPETAADVINLFDDAYGQMWYGVVLPAGDNADQLLAAATVQASINKHIHGATTMEPGVLVASTTTDLASLVKAGNYGRTLVQWSSKNANAVVSAMARLMGVNYTGNNTVITLKFKQEPGIEAESLPVSQVTVLQSKNCNVFVNYSNDTAIIEQGVMGDGEFADIITSTDWLAVTIQRDLYNVLYTSPTKIPQTDAGQNVLLATTSAVCSQAVTNGMLAPGVWNSGGFGELEQGDYLDKGYYVYSASFNTQAPADRTARRAMPIQVAAKLAGAIHDIAVTVNVNQ
jgi:hypothetical protein